MPRFLRASLFALVRGVIGLGVALAAILAVGAVGAAVFSLPMSRSVQRVQQGAGGVVIVGGYGAIAACVVALRVANGVRQRRALAALSDDADVYGYGLLGRGVRAAGTLGGRPWSAHAYGWDHLTVVVTTPSRTAIFVGPGAPEGTVEIKADPAVSARIEGCLGALARDLGWAEMRTVLTGDGTLRLDSRGGGWGAFSPTRVRAHARGAEAVLDALERAPV